MWYYLYKISDGELISDSSTPIEAQTGRDVKEFADRQSGAWNNQTLEFGPYPPSRVIPLSDFIDLFTSKEQEDLIEATKTIKKAATFVEVLKLKGIADLDSTFIQVAIVSMEGAPTNILSEGRAAEILA